MPFPSTWLCEAGFSALVGIKNKGRNKLIEKPDLRCALEVTKSRIDELIAKMQHQPSGANPENFGGGDAVLD